MKIGTTFKEHMESSKMREKTRFMNVTEKENNEFLRKLVFQTVP